MIGSDNRKYVVTPSHSAAALPEHIEQTIRATAGLYADHHGAATQIQRVVARMVDLLGRQHFSAC
jgi:hypothetical protein